MAVSKYPTDASGRKLPRPELKNQISEFVHWFYTIYMGQQPDSTVYSYGTALLRDLMEPGPSKFRDARAYTAQELASMLYYLKDNGVRVDGLEILKTYDLMRSYVTDNKPRLQRLVEFFRTRQTDEGVKALPPDGW